MKGLPAVIWSLKTSNNWVVSIVNAKDHIIFELLAPAGNLEKLKIAVLYGADAVYLAGQLFSLRKAANNFSLSDIKKAISFAHSHKAKVYLTVNAFLHEAETSDLIDYLQELNHIQPDALICSDLGVIALAKVHTTIPIHVSTQASVVNSYHAQIWKDIGVKRVVVGRELSILEAAKIKENTGLEIEMFVHGAMCMSYSGHCAMSTYVANRDSNRGGCIQNCRYHYTLKSENQELGRSHLLSSKDLCGINLLPDFISSGIDSIKIEGRMKSNLYIASTVRAYANAIKEVQSNTSNPDKWQQELEKVPYRGYTEANLKSNAGKDSVYDQSGEQGKDYKMAGTVIDVDISKKRFAFQVKNKLHIGDTIELMPFRGEIIELTIERFEDLSGQELTVAQPHNVIWLPWFNGVEASNVARIRAL